MARPRTASSRKPARRRSAAQAAPRGVRYWDSARGRWMIRERSSGRAVPAYGPEADRPAPTFDPRAALRQAGLSAETGAQRTADVAGAVGRRAYRQEIAGPTASAGELIIFAGASLLGLALLDTALSGRGPAGVERVLAGMGAGIRRLFDPRDPLVRSADAPAFTPPGLGGPSRAPGGREAGAAGQPSPTGAGGVYPLGRKGQLIGTPHAGTHTRGNWQSDNAVDLRVPVGTPVYAVADGRISPTLGYGDTGQGGVLAGKRLHLESNAGPRFYYAHLSRIVVPRGARVREGQLIGYSGSAVGVPHLHFAVDSGSIFSWIDAQVRRAAGAVRRAVAARER